MEPTAILRHPTRCPRPTRSNHAAHLPDGARQHPCGASRSTRSPCWPSQQSRGAQRPAPVL